MKRSGVRQKTFAVTVERRTVFVQKLVVRVDALNDMAASDRAEQIAALRFAEKDDREVVSDDVTVIDAVEE